MYGALLYLWLITERAYAQSPIATYCNILHPGCGGGRLFIVQLANRVIDVVSVLIIGFAVTEVVKAGILLITSGYNEENRGKAKTNVMTALLGVILAVLAKTIVYFVGDFITTYAPPL